MAFIVKISVIFLLSIFLLSCSSHAHDHDLPEVRIGDRKLLAVSASRLVNGFSRLTKSDEETKALVKKIKNTVQLLQHTKADVKKFAFARRVINEGAANAQKLFAASGNKELRVGWKAGKWIYKVDKKCEELAKALDFKCDQEDSTLTDVVGVSCVLSVAINNGGVGCKEELSGTTESNTEPCLYVGSGHYRKSGKVNRFMVNPFGNCPY